ncbi:hypothetical protein DFH06DRAFT_1342842 [Mycena polygramma]|nr:hypothetical protein DFH06DRAFT_1342842 [Mycena polygramma]
MASSNPTARPAKAPWLSSMPSTPGPEVPGGYPRNSVVFASNQWEKGKKGKKGLLASTKAFLPSYFPSSSSSSSRSASTSPGSTPSTDPPRTSSAGNTPGVALHLPPTLHLPPSPTTLPPALPSPFPSSSSSFPNLPSASFPNLNPLRDSPTLPPSLLNAGSNSSRGTLVTPGDFPTPGGRTFGARARGAGVGAGAGGGSSLAVEHDYFGVVVIAGSNDAAADTGVNSTSPPLAATSAATSLLTPPGSSASPASLLSVSVSASVSPALSTPSSALASVSVSASHSTTPSSASASSNSKSKPTSLRYAPSTAPSRPGVTKTGSAAGAAFHGLGSGLGRGLKGVVRLASAKSVRGRRSSGALAEGAEDAGGEPGDEDSAPPSAFHTLSVDPPEAPAEARKRKTSSVHFLDSPLPSLPSTSPQLPPLPASAPPSSFKANVDPNTSSSATPPLSKPSHRASLLRTLRGGAAPDSKSKSKDAVGEGDECTVPKTATKTGIEPEIMASTPPPKRSRRASLLHGLRSVTSLVSPSSPVSAPSASLPASAAAPISSTPIPALPTPGGNDRTVVAELNKDGSAPEPEPEPETTSKPSRRVSLMHTLRSEASLLAARLKRRE